MITPCKSYLSPEQGTNYNVLDVPNDSTQYHSITQKLLYEIWNQLRMLNGFLIPVTVLAGEPLDSSSIHVEWSPWPPADSYTLERSLVPDFSVVDDTFAGLTGTSFNDTGLDPNTTYYYRVKVIVGAGESDWSNVFFATTIGYPIVFTYDYSNIRVFGDSISVPQGATTSHAEYYAGALLKTIISNNAISGSGVWRMCLEASDVLGDNLIASTPNDAMVIAMCGLNDIRFNGDGTPDGSMYSKINVSYKHLLSMQFLDPASIIWPFSDPAVVKTYDPLTASYFPNEWRSVGGLSVNITDGAYYRTAPPAAYGPAAGSIKYSFSGKTNVVLGLVGGNSALPGAFPWGPADIRLDGVTVATLDMENYFGAVNDSGGQPIPYIIWDLNPANTYDVEVFVPATGFIGFDYIGHLKDPYTCAPVLLNEIPLCTPAGYATPPANANATISGLASAQILSVVNEFRNRCYPVAYMPTNDFYTLGGNVGVDGVHPNDGGQEQISQGERTVSNNNFFSTKPACNGTAE